MKIISKETNIAVATIYGIQIASVLYQNPDVWYLLFILPITYTAGYFFTKLHVKKLKQKRIDSWKKRLAEEEGFIDYEML